MKICHLPKPKIAEINKFLRKNGIDIFKVKELKDIKEDALNVFYLHDYLVIRGYVVNKGDNHILAIKSGIEIVDILVMDSDHKPLKIVEQFDFWNDDLEEE